MLGSQVLEVAVGLIFVYLLLSLLCSALSELIEACLKGRAKYLEEGIRNLLNDPDKSRLAQALYEHPLIKGLYRKGSLPSYIPSRTFAQALMDLVAPSGRDTVQKLTDAINKIENASVKHALATLVADAQGDLIQVRQNIEQWFDSAMERVSGWYKRRAQAIIFVLGLITAVALNADTITIADALSHDPALRESLITVAQEYAKQSPLGDKNPATPDGTTKSPEKKVEEVQRKIQDLGLPLGWSAKAGDPRGVPQSLESWMSKILGIFVTGVAISFGAPFWFDLLNKVIALRSTGKPRQ